MISMMMLFGLIVRAGKSTLCKSCIYIHSIQSKKRTFVNITKSYIGAGVLAIPFSIKEGGAIVCSANCRNINVSYRAFSLERLVMSL